MLLYGKVLYVIVYINIIIIGDIVRHALYIDTYTVCSIAKVGYKVEYIGHLLKLPRPDVKGL